MLTYLLIAVVVALALAPLLNVIPSPRQRRLAALREFAILHGLFVEFRALPVGDAQVQRAHGDVIYYGLRLASVGKAAQENAIWLHRDGEWVAVGSRRPAPVTLATLPATVLGAGIDSVSCGVYWVESGETADVEQIRRGLVDWSDTLADRTAPG